MSHSINAITNKHQKQSKVHFKQYLYSSGEPEDYTSDDATPEHEARLRQQADRYYMVMRRKIRRDAQRLRTRFS